jgi:uncharacterized protein YqjF (DUF2071 family)
MAEWLPNWLSVLLGPRTFGLPYRLGRLHYSYNPLDGKFNGDVRNAAGTGRLRFSATFDPAQPPTSCSRGTLDEWIMERYIAFTCTGTKRRYFRVWHPPWPQVPAEVAMHDRGLLEITWPLFRSANICSANFSPGLPDVLMGRPRTVAIRGEPCNEGVSAPYPSRNGDFISQIGVADD